MTDKPVIPNCPQCGCGARYIWMVAKVKCEFTANGDIGRVISAGKRKQDTEPQYECGGGHIFTANAVS